MQNFIAVILQCVQYYITARSSEDTAVQVLILCRRVKDQSMTAMSYTIIQLQCAIVQRYTPYAVLTTVHTCGCMVNVRSAELVCSKPQAAYSKVLQLQTMYEEQWAAQYHSGVATP